MLDKHEVPGSIPGRPTKYTIRRCEVLPASYFLCFLFYGCGVYRMPSTPSEKDIEELFHLFIDQTQVDTSKGDRTLSETEAESKKAQPLPGPSTKELLTLLQAPINTSLSSLGLPETIALHAPPEELAARYYLRSTAKLEPSRGSSLKRKAGDTEGLDQDADPQRARPKLARTR
jgi:hypothetical protein